MVKQNKGEWSELYAFVRLLKDGRIYAADEFVNPLNDIYFPILKLIRTDEDKHDVEYTPGDIIRIYKDGNLLGEISKSELEAKAEILFQNIFDGSDAESGSFEIPSVESLIERLKVFRIKSPSREKIDIRMQVHDIKTGIDSVSGFSVKSDVGSPPTLLNAGKNTRFKYEILGIKDDDMEVINSIDKTCDSREYMKTRMRELFKRADTVRYYGMRSETFEDNLMLIDSMLPEIYGDYILYHYMTMDEGPLDCETLCEVLSKNNPIGYHKTIIYRYKIKKLLCASALGMTPGSEWDGNEAATGGYIIVKRDGNVLCYHLYNRNFFEEYLLKNTVIDRPSATKFDYAYIYKEGNRYFIDLNVQIRFKSISASRKKANAKEKEMEERIEKYLNVIRTIMKK